MASRLYSARQCYRKKDLVNVFVLIAAGVVGFLTASAAIGNLYLSRRNLQQQRELDERRAQDEALQAYYEQLGNLLTEHRLTETENNGPLRLLAQAQTLTVLRRVDITRKGDVIRFLCGAQVITGENPIVHLRRANLIGAELSEADLSGAFFVGADLSKADLSGADLSGAHLLGTNLIGTDLSGADLSKADLRGAILGITAVDPRLINDLLESAALMDFLRNLIAFLRGANRSITSLKAFLRGAILRGATTQRPVLMAHLRGANLSGAFLIGANLIGADLSGADLSKADLSGARGVNETLKEAKSLKGATMPDGSMHE